MAEPPSEAAAAVRLGSHSLPSEMYDLFLGFLDARELLTVARVSRLIGDAVGAAHLWACLLDAAIERAVAGLTRSWTADGYSLASRAALVRELHDEVGRRHFSFRVDRMSHTKRHRHKESPPSQPRHGDTTPGAQVAARVASLAAAATARAGEPPRDPKARRRLLRAVETTRALLTRRAALLRVLRGEPLDDPKLFFFAALAHVAECAVGAAARRALAGDPVLLPDMALGVWRLHLLVVQTPAPYVPRYLYQVLLSVDHRAYDVTRFVERHPGGAGAMRRYGGRDATEVFNVFGHSKRAHALMRRATLTRPPRGARRRRLLLYGWGFKTSIVSHDPTVCFVAAAFEPEAESSWRRRSDDLI